MQIIHEVGRNFEKLPVASSQLSVAGSLLLLSVGNNQPGMGAAKSRFLPLSFAAGEGNQEHAPGDRADCRVAKSSHTQTDGIEKMVSGF